MSLNWIILKRSITNRNTQVNSRREQISSNYYSTIAGSIEITKLVNKLLQTKRWQNLITSNFIPRVLLIFFFLPPPSTSIFPLPAYLFLRSARPIRILPDILIKPRSLTVYSRVVEQARSSRLTLSPQDRKACSRPGLGSPVVVKYAA